MSSASYLHDALQKQDVDICGISEHWLFDENAHLLNSIHPNYLYFAVCDFSTHALSDHKTRKGGVAFLWKKNISSRVTVVDSDDDHIVILKLVSNSSVWHLIQVYIPNTRYGSDIFNDYVDKLDSLCASFSLQGSVIIMGDFNARLSGPRIPNYQNYRGLRLQRCLDRYQLSALTTSFFCSGPLYTYVHSDDGISSLIDHVIIDSSKTDLISNCYIGDQPYLDVSSHRPIFCDILFPTASAVKSPQIERSVFKWPSDGTSSGTEVYHDNLHQFITQSNLISFRLNNISDIDSYTDLLTKGIHDTALSSLQKRKFNKFLKPYWKGELKELHRDMWRLRCIWDDEGRPRDPNSQSFCLYKDAKRKFRRKRRQLSENHLITLNSDIEEAADINQKSFWSLVRSRAGGGSRGSAGAEVMFGNQTVRDPAALALHWGEYFSGIYSHYTDRLFDNDFKSSVESELAEFLSHDAPATSSSEITFTVDEVNLTCKSLPLGKAPGIDSIVYEHLNMVFKNKLAAL
ncbi:uncharacterized protein LOC132547560 [Ylistrum balloti]|uniref:uncharacterized protein LOC132547560 n=1 Tax=Ylistrum balloti TaxID=509963 RepID=UPI0029059DA2|nr:uncharacterized protein LOC132547560 [Ylistrum balloti]